MEQELVDGSDQVITAAGGRRVGFRRYGADAEPSLLYLHGCPGSRAEVRLYEPDLLQEMGVCAIAVDRAGYGLTDPADDWDVLARVRDAVAVADAVGMSMFAVQGTSAGGSYALAVAATVPNRVRAVILAGGQGRLDTDWAFDDMPGDFAETRQGGVGYWLDGQTRGRPWPFAVDAIQAPIHVFHGDRDGWNPLPALRRSLAGAAQIHEHIYAGGDHLSPWTTRERRSAMLREVVR